MSSTVQSSKIFCLVATQSCVEGLIEVAAGCISDINNAWEHIWTANFNKVRVNVKNCKPKIKKENYMEK